MYSTPEVLNALCRNIILLALARSAASEAYGDIVIATVVLSDKTRSSYDDIYGQALTDTNTTCFEDCKALHTRDGHHDCFDNCNGLQTVKHVVQRVQRASKNPVNFLLNRICGSAPDVEDSWISKSNAVVLSDRSSNDPLTDARNLNLTTVLSYTLGYLGIPVISTHTRDSQFSNRVLYPTFFRLSASLTNQGDVIVKLLLALQYKTIILICSDDVNGAAIQSRIENLADEFNIEIEKSFSVNEFLSGSLEHSEGTESTVFVVHSSGADSESILAVGRKDHLFGRPYVWILSEPTFKAAKSAPVGFLGIASQDTSDDVGKLLLSYKVLLRGMINFGFNRLQTPDGSLESSQYRTRGNAADMGSCNRVASANSGRRQFVEELTKSFFVKFNTYGDIRDVEYNVTNIGKLFKKKHVGTIGHDNTESTIATAEIIWPGNYSFPKPNGTQLPMNLIIATAVSEPIVYGGYHDYASNCSAVPTNRSVKYPFTTFFRCWDHRKAFQGQTSASAPACCGGFALAVIVNMSRSLGFKYTIHLIDNDYASQLYTKKDDEDIGPVGLTAYLYDKKAHIGAGTLSLDVNHRRFIDISEPFDYHGMHILQRVISRSSPIESFLQPFDWKLWVCIFFSVVIVAILLFVLDRMSPFRSEPTIGQEDNETDTTMNLPSGFWFAWGVILNSGIGEKTPHSFSARVLGMVWCGFVMIIVASYTANLAAFLVLDRPVKMLSGIDDPRLRNPSSDFMYGTVAGSGVYQYFKLRAELTNMFRQMDTYNVESSDEGVRKVKNEELQAFIWESRTIEYEIARDTECILTKTKRPFGRQAYVLGLRKNSLWKDRINTAIMEMQEDLFILMTAGLVIGALLITLEVLISRPDERQDIFATTPTTAGGWPSAKIVNNQLRSPDDGGFNSTIQEVKTRFMKLSMDGSYV